MLHPTRTNAQDTILALTLITIAGAVNAGGFLAVGHYTSHMSGMVAESADALATRNYAPIAFLATGLFAFILGAATCGWLAGWARRHRPHLQYALPIALEGILILVFGMLESAMSIPHGMSTTMALLCFIMGLQNATITRASGERIRTTHVTGISTDLGIEIGHLLHKTADLRKLALLAGLLAMFFGGGLLGAYGFLNFGPAFTLPIGLVLLAMALPTVLGSRR
ncbi:MAG: DUF1275 domain-containing protein [Alphaproteobacteria bacterium]|nr:MAG: DUF1275 domain-containing protein [Alphaproteobacteria bacterium]